MTEGEEQSKANTIFDKLKAAFDQIEQEVVVFPLSENVVEVEGGCEATQEEEKAKDES